MLEVKECNREVRRPSLKHSKGLRTVHFVLVTWLRRQIALKTKKSCGEGIHKQGPWCLLKLHHVGPQVPQHFLAWSHTSEWE